MRPAALPAAIGFPDVRSGASATSLSKLTAIQRAGSHYSKKAELLFVTEWSPPEIQVYTGVREHHFKLATTITNSINTPQQIATDSSGNLYVSSALGDYVTEFANGAVIPNREIANGLTEPFGVVVDSDGTLYVSNQYPPTIVEYPKGASNPSLTITSGMFGILLGETLDASGNLYVADDVKNQVFEVPKGSETPKSLFLEMPGCSGGSEPYYPVGLAFDSRGRLYVSCSAAGNVVLVYKLPKVTPIATLSTDMNEPYLLSFDPHGSLFVANFGGGNIEELAPPKYNKVISTLGASEPIGGYIRPRL
jgi:sugar lactone lactonase YvrE